MARKDKDIPDGARPGGPGPPAGGRGPGGGLRQFVLGAAASAAAAVLAVAFVLVPHLRESAAQEEAEAPAALAREPVLAQASPDEGPERRTRPARSPDPPPEQARTQPVHQLPDLPARSVTIWQHNSRNELGPDGTRTTVYEFSISTRGSPLGVIDNMVIETNAGQIVVPGPMDGTREGGYRVVELRTDEFVDAFHVTSATATVYGVPGQDIVPFLFVLDYQPMPILLPDDPESLLSVVRRFEIPKFLLDAPVDFGDDMDDAPSLVISDFLDAAIEIYRETEDAELLVWNRASLTERPVEAPYVVLFSRDGVNGFSVMEPSGSGFQDDLAVFTFSCRVAVDPETQTVWGLDPEVTVNGQRQDLAYAAANHPIVARAFSFGL